MTSNAKSQEFAVIIVRSDGAEGATGDGGRSGRNQQTLLSDKICRRMCPHHSKCSAWSHRIDGHAAARDLIFQGVITLHKVPSKTQRGLLSIRTAVSFPENAKACLNPCFCIKQN